MDLGDSFFVATNPPSPHSFAPQPIHGSSSSSGVQEKTGMVLFFAVTIISILFVSICSVRQYFKNCRGITNSFCTKIFSRESRETRYSEQYYEDRVLAENLQRRINEEERERERLAKRKERRMWYEYYIKPWTMIIEKSDLFHAHRDVLAIEKGRHVLPGGEEDEGTKMNQTKTIGASKEGDGTVLDSDIEEVSEDGDRRQISECYICDEEDENATLYLKLPVSGRCVDGTCAFCIDEYEVGDTVVWSGLQCPHAFHKECLMQWLSKGKKRCPICRHWFVPGSKIDDQKLNHGEAWQHALSDMEQREKEEKQKQANETEQKTKASNDLEQGIVKTTNTLPSCQSISTMIASQSHHNRSGRDELGRTISCGYPGHSYHSPDFSSTAVAALNDIESQQMVLSEEQPGKTSNASSDDCDNETKSQREASIRSEEYIVEK